MSTEAELFKIESQEKLNKVNKVIRDLYFNKNVKMEQIAKRLEVSPYYVKKVVDPQTVEAWNRKNRTKREKKGTKRSDDPIYDPKRDEKLFHNSVTAMMCGDPLPGRSALDQRMKGNG